MQVSKYYHMDIAVTQTVAFTQYVRTLWSTYIGLARNKEEVGRDEGFITKEVMFLVTTLQLDQL